MSGVEQLLCMLLWTLEGMSRPTYRGMQSFESWAHRNGFGPQLRELEQRTFIESRRPDAAKRILRLSEEARLHALGGADPEARWGSRWDGQWRVVLFDLPRHEGTARRQLHRRLRAERFGLLQNSVWVSPHPVDREVLRLSNRGEDVGTLLMLEGRQMAGESNGNIVSRAWDFEEVNHAYAIYLNFLAGLPADVRSGTWGQDGFSRWLRRERHAWEEAFFKDPLLPERLLPRGYRGKKAWKKRKQVMTSLVREIVNASPRMATAINK